MNWSRFNNIGDSYQQAFETFCNQLFERYLRRKYLSKLIDFQVINGAGGDGGIEAYGKLNNGKIIAVQAKWFRSRIDIEQIRQSVTMAMTVRPEITEYIICIPRNITSSKIGRGKRIVTNTDEGRINKLVKEIYTAFPKLKLTWWFDHSLLEEIQHLDNEGVQKYWFDKEVISLSSLKQKFAYQKEQSWLKERYAAGLYGKGTIDKAYRKSIFSKDFRKEFFYKVEELQLKLITGCKLIEKYLLAGPLPNELEISLITIQDNFEEYYLETVTILDAIEHKNRYYAYKKINEVDIWPTLLKLEKINPTNLQKPIARRLIQALKQVHQLDIDKFLASISNEFRKLITLMLGKAGTGKTNGLAACVEQHLQAGSPALIIQAKGSSCGDWTKLLSDSLELPGWRKEEIFSALEGLAVRNDIQQARNNPNQPIEHSCVLLCIDGLEEDILNTEQWYNRLRECGQVLKQYPRVRFIFSARPYFYDASELSESDTLQIIRIPTEGDTPVMEAAKKYFEPANYNIKLSKYSRIKGLDNLYALKLFCEYYQNQELDDERKIVTATEDLLNLKIDKLEAEYKATITRGLGTTQKPVRDALLIISDCFYRIVEIEHTDLRKQLQSSLDSILSGNEIDLMLDFFCLNGILIRYERREKKGVIKVSKYFYNISYQSIIEHILSENVYHRIASGTLDQIPAILRQGLVAPLDNDWNYTDFHLPPNEKITQNIVIKLFVETQQLIGENNFLIEGFNSEEIFNLKMAALQAAPKHLAIQYKSLVDELFFRDAGSRYDVFSKLILPSASDANKPFGAGYLHNILINQASSFDRDKLWSGLDRYETRNLVKDTWSHYYYTNPANAFDDLNTGTVYLSEYQRHDELPLVYAWGLSNISQSIRDQLRIALTGWAIERVMEYIKLLDKVFFCNDPQIQEDLASVSLGVASKLRNEKGIKALAKWAIKYIFSHTDQYRNVIIRQGFRSIVERAYLLGLITNAEVLQCRPKKKKSVKLLPLDKNAIKLSKEGIYPIVHDLAWYVIEKAFDGFLEYPSRENDQHLESRDCKEGKSLLDHYRKKYNKKDIYARGWAMAAALAYIRNLGFNRTEGNGSTDASHGSKSEVFTYEEKYTWLAVHYLMGYLSDYVPKGDWHEPRSFITDYSVLTDIPNPSEKLLTIADTEQINDPNSTWIIPEELSPTISKTGDLEQNIIDWSHAEPQIDFKKWIYHPGENFYSPVNKQDWTALFNYTSLHDATNCGHSALRIYACIIPVKQFKNLLKTIRENPDSLRFIRDLDDLEASPNAYFYSNPSDIVWMNWIEEAYSSIETAIPGGVIYKTICRLTQNTRKGEKTFYIPSKKIRSALGTVELHGSYLNDNDGKIVSFTHECSEGSYQDSQHLLLADRDLLQSALVKEGFKMLWFAQLFRHTNPLNEELPQDYDRAWKTRKYLVWEDGLEMKQHKFWDEEASNTRDEQVRKQQAYEKLDPEERLKILMKSFRLKS